MMIKNDGDDDVGAWAYVPFVLTARRKTIQNFQKYQEVLKIFGHLSIFFGYSKVSFRSCRLLPQ